MSRHPVRATSPAVLCLALAIALLLLFVAEAAEASARDPGGRQAPAAAAG